MNLDAATGAKILAADFTNLMKKVQSGKPLTTAERALVEKHMAATEAAEAAAAAKKTKVSKGKSKKLGVAPNMAAAAARTGLEPDAVKEAKARGCAAFHQSGRVDCDALLEYAIANPQLLEQDDGKPNRQLEEALLIRTNRLIREQKLLEIRNKIISRAEMGQRLRALALDQKAILEKELKDRPKVVAKVCAQMRALVEAWKE